MVCLSFVRWLFCRAIDFICLKITPYYEGLGVECPLTAPSNCISASDYANAKAEGLSKFYTKDVWVCETGWPTAGDACCFGIPDEEDQLQATTRIPNCVAEYDSRLFLHQLQPQGIFLSLFRTQMDALTTSLRLSIETGVESGVRVQTALKRILR